jgi:hypothetical protein
VNWVTPLFQRCNTAYRLLHFPRGLPLWSGVIVGAGNTERVVLSWLALGTPTPTPSPEGRGETDGGNGASTISENLIERSTP